jgi:hypothetical protein
LWKRIPNSVKSENAELSKIWEVGKALWRRDPPSVFLAIQAHAWSDNIKDIMNAIKGVLSSFNRKNMLL